ncbi:hypothetical protein OHB44_09955 [Micromonospora sp. NBC_00821]|uniref:hypothetical protein n=1 Tax=Micromonospora sp. NBC_00821 TaxID=2975977 RepID=UPI002ED0F710|nr:hypothetical protein OHB44_09955 [Micromonospora sp. NBC_00821]
MPWVADGCVVGVEEGCHDVAQPSAVAPAAGALASFGPGFLEHVGDVGEDRRGAGRGGPVTVRGLRGAVHEQPVAGGHEALVAGLGRVGDVGALGDVGGVDLDA